MKAKYIVPMAFASAAFFQACSDSSSSAPESSSSVAESSSSVSEFAPINFERLNATVGVKVTLAGDVLVDTEYDKVADASDAKLDSVQVTVKQVSKDGLSATLLTKDVEFDAPASNVSLNAVSIGVDELEKCGKFRGYVWAFASGAENVPYSAVDSLEFNIPEEFCEEEELPSSSSAKPEITECTEMEAGELTISNIDGDEALFANLETGKVSVTEEEMQITLSTSGEYPMLKVVGKDYKVAEADVSYKAGIVPEQVCLEEIKSFADTRGESVEIVSNGWFTLEGEEGTYLIMVGKIAESDGNASVQLTYWKKKLQKVVFICSM